MARKVDAVNQPDDAPLFDLLYDVLHRFKGAAQAAIVDDEAGLAPTEARALQFVARHAGATATEMVRHSGRDKGQVARLLAGLEARGLVARAPGADRRSHTLQLTRAGAVVHRRLERKRERAAAALFAGFSPAERATLASLLRRFVEA